MGEKRVPIKINIAGHILPLEVEISEQDDIRDSEQRVNAIFAEWQKRYPHKPDSELLAMLTFRYASFYYRQKNEQHKIAHEIDAAAQAIGSLL